MPVTVRNIILWRREVENRAGILASTLEPLAKGGADLQVLMGYRFPGNEAKAMIEIYPVTGRALTRAAQEAGLSSSSIPTLLVQGDNKPGLGYAIAQAIAQAGINLTFLVAQVIGRRYSAVIGFDTADDEKKAAALIKKATAAKPGSSSIWPARRRRTHAPSRTSSRCREWSATRATPRCPPTRT